MELLRSSGKEKEKQHLFIQLLGVPASGKTTLAKYLGERLGFQVLEEYPVSEIPLFGKYYSDPDKWAFSIWQNAFYAQARLEKNPQELAWYNDFFDGLVRSNSLFWIWTNTARRIIKTGRNS